MDAMTKRHMESSARSYSVLSRQSSSKCTQPLAWKEVRGFEQLPDAHVGAEEETIHGPTYALMLMLARDCEWVGGEGVGPCDRGDGARRAGMAVGPRKPPLVPCSCVHRRER